MSETGWYLYAITRKSGGAGLGDDTGIGGAPLRAVEHRDLAAIVSPVDLDEFGEEALRANLEDFGWLETVARAHHAVVDHLSARTVTAPLRLATICRDEDGVRARLDEWHDALRRALDRIDGRAEWSVKVFAAPDEGDEPMITPVAGPPAAGSPAGRADRSEGGPGRTGRGAGAAYLQRRRAENARRENLRSVAAAAADEVHAELSRYAAASRRLRPQDRRLAGYDGVMALNGAYLVDVATTEDFRAAVSRLADRQPAARIEVGGPWPPYSFASLDDR